MANNFEIHLALLDRQVARTDLLEARSQYDTKLTFGSSYQVEKKEQPSAILGARTTTGKLEVGLEKTLATGTTLGVDWINERQSSDALFATADLLYDSQVRLSATQPLMSLRS